jgi:hypothetical protein
MPGASKHLDWHTVKDFTPGLVETGDWLIPAGASPDMLNCYPQPSGGLRAFFKPTALTMTGIGAGERIIGLFAYSTSHRTLSTFAVDYYCATYSGTDYKPRVYRYDTTDATQTGWTEKLELTAATGNNSPKLANFLAYVLADGTKRIVVSIGYGHGDSGVYAADQADDTATQSFAKITSTLGLGPICVHQNRLCEARGSVVYFTGVGDEDFSAATAGYVDVEPQRVLADIKALIPMAPGDLLIGKEGAAWSSIQGELSDPVVRTMSEGHFLGHRDQTLADTGEGIAFIEPDSGIYLTSMGSGFTRIDEQLDAPEVPTDAAVAVAYGELVFHKHWLFAPRGRVFDFTTKSWFEVDGVSTTPGWVQAVDRFSDTLINATTTPTIDLFDLDEANGARRNTYRWKSARLRADDGRRIRVREVQLAVRSYAATSGITVTVNGVARTISNIAEGYNVLRFKLRTEAETLDVLIECDSGNASVEAPSIEVLRIGTISGHTSQ